MLSSEAMMRQRFHNQLWFAPSPGNDPIQQEYEEISKLLDSQPRFVELVCMDLNRGRKSSRGAKGLTGEQTLRALLVQRQHNLTYKELAFYLNDSITYRWFCRIPPNKNVSRSALHRALKAVRYETIEEINRGLVAYAIAEGLESSRKVRTDCTVVESNIHSPTDSRLLWDVVRVLVRLLKRAQQSCSEVSLKNHTRVAKRRAFRIENAKSKQQRLEPYRDLLRYTEKTVGYAKRAVEILDGCKSPDASTLTSQIRHYLELAEKVITQTRRRVIDGESVPACDKVVSLFEPHTDIIVKDRREVLYGHKLCLTTGASGLILDGQLVDGNPADSTLALEAIARVAEISGRPPRQATFDGSFSSINNLTAIKQLGVRDVVFTKSRGIEIEDMAKSDWVYNQLRKFRAGIEGTISFLKRSLGLSRCVWRGLESFKAYTWSAMLSANMLTIARLKLKTT